MATSGRAPAAVRLPTVPVPAGPGRRPLALLAACHPAPTVAVTAFGAVLTAALGARAGTVVLVGVAVLLGQLSVGWSNDWLDAARDRAVGRADKPVARGEVGVGVVRGAAVAAAAGCLVASWATGVLPGALHVLAVASAWAYNLGLKRTAASVVPYAVSFGLLPAFCALAAGAPASAALVVPGVLLGAGAHLTNVLPDLDDDAATGVRGLPHRLGRRGTSVLAPALLAAGVVAVVVAVPSPGAVGGGAGAVGLAVAAGIVGALRPASRAPFALSMAVAAACVALLVQAGPALR